MSSSEPRLQGKNLADSHTVGWPFFMCFSNLTFGSFLHRVITHVDFSKSTFALPLSNTTINYGAVLARIDSATCSALVYYLSTNQINIPISRATLVKVKTTNVRVAKCFRNKGCNNIVYLISILITITSPFFSL